MHKTGELEDVRNIAGLVVHPEGTFALAVLTQGNVERAALRVKTAVSDLCNAFLGVATGR